jgi:hypothetical protein
MEFGNALQTDGHQVKFPFIENDPNFIKRKIWKFHPARAREKKSRSNRILNLVNGVNYPLETARDFCSQARKGTAVIWGNYLKRNTLAITKQVKHLQVKGEFSTTSNTELVKDNK